MKEFKKPRYAKAYGVKNNVYINNLIYTTTFGKKNESKLSKKTNTQNDKVEELDKSSQFDLQSKKNKLSVSLKGQDNSIKINNPKFNSKADIIGINPKIEKLIFNNNYNDNIHIQVGYNILDMNKIMSLYYYNIVCALNNLTRTSNISDDSEDFIGTLRYSKHFKEYNPYYDKDKKGADQEKKNKYTYEDVLKESKNNPQGFYKFDLNAKQSYPYFSIFKTYETIKKGDSESNKNNKEKKNESNRIYNYDILRILSFVRQAIAHSTPNREEKENKETLLNSLYRVNNDKNSLPIELKEIIDDKFNNDLKKINESFNENAKTNLWIISQVKGIRNNEYINELKDYYNFSIFKENKNLGISITRVRENIFAYYLKYGIDLADNKHDSYRSKLHLIYDYLIYDYLKPIAENYVIELRKTLTEEDKEKIYNNIAIRFVNSHKNLIKNKQDLICEKINESINDKTNSKQIKIDQNICSLDSNKFSIFSRLIYFISYFLEKKEKNDLITSLINKLDDIDSLNNIYYEIKGIKMEYCDNYSLFENAANIASELRIVKNLSHMEPKLEKASGAIYTDVLRSLGFTGTNDECQKIISEFENNKEKHPFRNFIINNVVQSSRFKYIVKYVNPQCCKEYIQNEPLIKYILNDLPEEQINRYYEKVASTFNNSLIEKDIGRRTNKKSKVDKIYKKLLDFNFDYLNGKFASISAKGKSEEIEKTKSLVNLYYTVIYLAVKNLVNINSVFIIAFECLERDYAIMKDLSKKDVYGSKSKELYLLKGNEENTSLNALAFYKKKNRHNYNYLQENANAFENIKPNACDIFKSIRNNTIHMNYINKAHLYFKDIMLDQIQKSEIGNEVPVYYELYAFILEKMTLEKYPVIINDKIYSKTVKNHYDKDLLKILLIPFGYNLARYKNLTIRDLYYDQYKEKAIINK